MQSYIFDFSRVPSFFENFNINFLVSDMDGTNKFELVLCKHGADNIGDYLDQNGCLNIDDSSSELLIIDCGLDFVRDEFGDAKIELHDEAVFDENMIGDQNIPIKAVFLRDSTTKYVMGYSFNRVPFTVTNKVIFDSDVIFWDITRINRNG